LHLSDAQDEPRKSSDKCKPSGDARHEQADKTLGHNPTSAGDKTDQDSESADHDTHAPKESMTNATKKPSSCVKQGAACDSKAPHKPKRPAFSKPGSKKPTLETIGPNEDKNSDDDVASKQAEHTMPEQASAEGLEKTGHDDQEHQNASESPETNAGSTGKKSRQVPQFKKSLKTAPPDPSNYAKPKTAKQAKPKTSDAKMLENAKAKKKEAKSAVPRALTSYAFFCKDQRQAVAGVVLHVLSSLMLQGDVSRPPSNDMG
jgi:hypothetical protein